MEVDRSTIDHRLHAELERLVRELGPSTPDLLARRARKALRDARLDDDAVIASVETSTLLVWRPDGTVDHLLHVLDGMLLTQRVRAPLAGRTELWATVSLQPLLNVAAFAPVPLANGLGNVVRADSGHEVLLGPAGWLPEVQHYRLERWYGGTDDMASRPGEMVRALAHARLEDPYLLSTPHPPLEELLYVALEGDRDAHYWRDHAAQQNHTCSFYVTGMPEALRIELNRRARRYGMSYDQYVVAVLGHLAWRTPFAEDMEPWDDWDPDRKAGVVRALPSTS